MLGLSVLQAVKKIDGKACGPFKVVSATVTDLLEPRFFEHLPPA